MLFPFSVFYAKTLFFFLFELLFTPTVTADSSLSFSLPVCVSLFLSSCVRFTLSHSFFASLVLPLMCLNVSLCFCLSQYVSLFLTLSHSPYLFSLYFSVPYLAIFSVQLWSWLLLYFSPT